MLNKFDCKCSLLLVLVLFVRLLVGFVGLPFGLCFAGCLYSYFVLRCCVVDGLCLVIVLCVDLGLHVGFVVY